MAIQSFFAASSKGSVCLFVLPASVCYFLSFLDLFGGKKEQVIKGSVLTPSLFVTPS